MKHVIYLDIDGVLAPFNRENQRELDPIACATLRDAARADRSDGATVVLCSSWHEVPTREALGTHGIEIAEVLPEERRTYIGRVRAIRRHIRKNRVRSWVWIDDDNLPKNKDGSSYVLDRRCLSEARHIRTNWSTSWPSGSSRGDGFNARFALLVSNRFRYDARTAHERLQCLERTLTKHLALLSPGAIEAHVERERAGFAAYIDRGPINPAERTRLLDDRAAHDAHEVEERQAQKAALISAPLRPIIHMERGVFVLGCGHKVARGRPWSIPKAVRCLECVTSAPVAGASSPHDPQPV